MLRVCNYSFFLAALFCASFLSAQNDTISSSKVNDFFARMEAAKAEYEGFYPTPFQAPDTEGVDHFLSNYDGQIVVLQFWQLACEPCLSQITSLHKLLEEYEDQSVAVLSFADEYGEELKEYIKERNLQYPVVPNARELGRTAYAADLGYPRVFIIDKFGIIRKLILGGSTMDEMDLYKEIKPIIEELQKE